MNLYRIMTNVRGGPHQRAITAGQLGIVTLWVRARSETVALARATFILTNKRYHSIGPLTCYAEALDSDPLASSTDDERAAECRNDLILAGYDALKEHALAQADGLHEVWLGASDSELLRNQNTG